MKRIRTWFLRMAFTSDQLSMWGERTTPGSLRFVWSYYEDDFYESLREAVAAGEISPDKYYLREKKV